MTSPSGRVVQVETDNCYFTLTILSLKSFLFHNKGWDVAIIQNGLTQEQRDELAGVGILIDSPGEGLNRWTHLGSRLRAISDLLERYEIVLHLDSDAFTFGSIAQWVLDFLQQPDAGISGDRVYDIGQSLLNPTKIKELYPDMPPEALLSPVMCNGVSMYKSLPSTRAMMRAVIEKWPIYYGMFPIPDESLIALEAIKHGCELYRISRTYVYPIWITKDNYPIGVHVTPSNHPVSAHAEPLMIVHMTGLKTFFNATGRHNAQWLAWMKVLEHYKDMPWHVVK